MCSAALMNRHLVFIGLGAMGILGQLIASSLHPRFWNVPRGNRRFRATLIVLLVGLHLVLAPIALAFLSRYPFGPKIAINLGPFNTSMCFGVQSSPLLGSLPD